MDINDLEKHYIMSDLDDDSNVKHSKPTLVPELKKVSHDRGAVENEAVCFKRAPVQTQDWSYGSKE